MFRNVLFARRHLPENVGKSVGDLPVGDDGIKRVAFLHGIEHNNLTRQSYYLLDV
jgi:hypothetical protein